MGSANHSEVMHAPSVTYRSECGSRSLPLAYGGALLAVMATYNGWANAAIIGGEVRDAERTIPWALVTGILIVTSLYVMTNEAFLHMLSFHYIATANSTSYPDALSVASLAVNHALALSSRDCVAASVRNLCLGDSSLQCIGDSARVLGDGTR